MVNGVWFYKIEAVEFDTRLLIKKSVKRKQSSFPSTSTHPSATNTYPNDRSKTFRPTQ